MQIIFSVFKNVIILILLAGLSGALSSLFLYIAIALFVITLLLFGRKWKEMARDRIDCYFSLFSAVIAIFCFQFDYVTGDMVNLAQFFAFVWILMSLAKLIENNRQNISKKE